MTFNGEKCDPEVMYSLLDKYPPIFVVGCPHSGNSLMQAVIGSHSRVHAIKGETRVYYEQSRRRVTRPLWFVRNTVDNIRLQKMCGFYNQAINHRKVRWVEKTPEHIHRMGAILDEQETAKIIVMIRDGRDVAASLFARSSDLKDSAMRWVSDNKIALHFVNNPRVLFVKYEDLVTRFEGTIRSVFEFIGEKYESEVKNFHKHQDVVSRPRAAKTRNDILRLRAWQITQPLFDGRGRYKEFDEEQYAYVYSCQKKILLRLGYIV